MKFRALIALVATLAPAFANSQAQHPNGWYWPQGTGALGGYSWLQLVPGRGYHLAADMVASEGAPLYALWDGEVLISAFHNGYDGDGSANCMAVRYPRRNGPDFICLYGHIRNPHANGTVRKGEIIAYANAGQSGGPHLHFGVRSESSLNASQWFVGYTNTTSDTKGFTDPYAWLNANSPPNVGAAPNVFWTHGVVEARWYRSDEHLVYHADGSDPMYCDEFIDGILRNTYQTHDGYISIGTPGPGMHDYLVHARNALGQADTPVWSGGWDNLPGSVALTSSLLTNHWYRGVQTVSWNCTDGHSGIKQNQFNWNGGGWAGLTFGGANATNLPEGQNALNVWCEDNAWTGTVQSGNTTTVGLGSFWLDNGLPSIASLTTQPPSPSNASTVQVLATATDAASGVNRVEVSVDGQVVGSIQGASGSLNWQTVAFSDGPHTISAVAIDNADPGGNRSTPASVPFFLDRVAPITQVSVTPSNPDGQNGWYVTIPTITLTGTDGQPSSGVRSVEYRVNGGQWVTYATPFALTSQGEVTLEVLTTDNAGNREASQARTIKVDPSRPPTPVLTDEGSYTTSLTNLAVSIGSSSDPESGLQGVEYTVGEPSNHSLWRGLTFATGTQDLLLIDGLSLPQGSNVLVYVRSLNGAGLWSEWAQTDGIQVDILRDGLLNTHRLTASLSSQSSDAALSLIATGGEALAEPSLSDELLSGFWGLRLPSVTYVSGLSWFGFFTGVLDDVKLADQRYAQLTPKTRADGSRTGSMTFEASTHLKTVELQFALQAVASTPGVRQQIELYDFVQGAWVVLQDQVIDRHETRATLSLPDARRFVEESTGKLRAKVSWLTPAIAPGRLPWQVKLNQAVWRVMQ